MAAGFKQLLLETDLDDHEAAADPHTVYVLKAGGLNDRVISWLVPNIASTTVAKDWSPPIPFAHTIVKPDVRTMYGETCGATSLIIDIHKNLLADENADTDTTIWTTQANRLTLTNGNKQADTETFDVTTGAAGDRYGVYVDQAGTGLSAVRVSLTVRPTA